MKKILTGILLVILMLTQVDFLAAVKINEVMQSNMGIVIDDRNEFPDSWVEFYNADTIALDITDFSVGLSADFETAYPISDSTIIPAGGYFLIYCDKENEGRHADFKLDVEGCKVFLFDAKGQVADSIVVPAMLAPGLAYGRLYNDVDSLGFFKQATPGNRNPSVCHTAIMKKPKFSKAGGVYAEPFFLKISKQGDSPADAVVRYTTNGSEPTDSSAILLDSLFIEKTTVVRAKVFSDSALSKETKTNTYIIPTRELSLPIVSIVADSSYFYGDELGILVEGTYGETHPDAMSDIPEYGNMNFLFSWNRPANVEYFDTRKNEKAVVNQLCDIEIGGNSSAMLPLKSLNVKAKKKYGENKFSYAFWDDKPNVAKSKCIYLRNGGQDYAELHMRDALAQISFGQNVDIDWQASQPVIVLINGQYYGMMNLREKANPDFVWSNYNKLDNIDMITETNQIVKAGDKEEFCKYYNLICENGLALAELEKTVDLDEMMNYFIVNVFYANRDWPGNNQLLWRERTENGKWRFIAKDMDLTVNSVFSETEPDMPYFNYVLRTEPFEETDLNKPISCQVFKKALSFPEIKNQVVDRMSVYMGTFISEDACNARVDSFTSILEPEIPYFYDHFGKEEWRWHALRDNYKEWIGQRVPYMYHHIQEFFGLGDTVALKVLKYKPVVLYMNNVKMADGQKSFDGKYFYGRPLVLSHEKDACFYNGDSLQTVNTDSVSGKATWYITWKEEGKSVYRRIEGEPVLFSIPDSVSDVVVSDSLIIDTSSCDSLLSLFLRENACVLTLEEVEMNRPVVTDNYGNVLQAHLKETADSFGVGASVLDWSFITVFGDTLGCRQEMLVADVSAPTYTLCDSMPPIVFDLKDSSCGLAVDILEIPVPIAEDNCGMLINGVLDEDFKYYEIGDHSLVWTFADSSENKLVCEQLLKVNDSFAPEVDCDSLLMVRLEMREGADSLELDEVTLNVPTAKDNCDKLVYGVLQNDEAFVCGENSLVWLFVDEGENESVCKQTLFLKKKTMDARVEKSTTLNVWPNPVTSFAQIEGVESGVPFEVYNSAGEVIIKSRTTSNVTLIDTKTWAEGVYVLQILGEAYKLQKQL